MECEDPVNLESLLKDLPKLQEDSSRLKSLVIAHAEDLSEKLADRPKPLQLHRDVVAVYKQGIDINTEVGEIRQEYATAQQTITSSLEQVQKIDVLLKMCNEIAKHHEEVKKLETYIECKSVLQACNQITALLSDLRQIECGKLNEKLADKLLNYQAIVLEMLDNVFKENIVCTKEVGVNSWRIKEDNAEMDEAVKTVFQLQNQCEENILLPLANSFWDAAVLIVKYQCEIEISSSQATLKISNQESDYKNSLDNLISLSQFFSSNLKYSQLWRFISANLPGSIDQLIINHCLEKTLPSNEAQLKNYAQVVETTKNAQSNLIESGLLEADCNTLAEYVDDVKHQYARNECINYNKLAVTILKKDLHNTISVGQPFNTESMYCEGFLECAVSKSVVEYLEMVEALVKKSIQSEASVGCIYLETAETLLQIYPMRIEEYFESLLKTIPQQGALFYNNCKYISNQLYTAKWRNCKMELIAGELNQKASEMMHTYIDEQARLIKERIDASGIREAGDKFNSDAEKAIRQCLRQQELLKTVWQKVLNHFDYNNSMGTLLDALCESLVNNVLMIADMAADVADQLVDVIKVIITRGPKLFTEPKEILMYVKGWDRLNELVFILNANLEAIDERWADGKGPLGLHFNSDELRSLIRALFQNSAKRALMLSKFSKGEM